MKLGIAHAFELRRYTEMLKNVVDTSRLISFVIFSVISFLFSCADKAPRGSIPFAPVDFEINLNGLDHVLRNPLSFRVFTEQDRRFPEERFGFSGVVIVSSATANELYAYDLCCPHEKKREIKVAPQDDGTAICEGCGSVFATIYGRGTVMQGPATEELQSYLVYPLPVQPGTFRVTNGVKFFLQVVLNNLGLPRLYNFSFKVHNAIVS